MYTTDHLQVYRNNSKNVDKKDTTKSKTTGSIKSQGERHFDSHSSGVHSHTHTCPISSGTVEGDSPSTNDHDIIEDQQPVRPDSGQKYRGDELLQSSSPPVGTGTHEIALSSGSDPGGQYHLGHPREVFRHIQPLVIQQKAMKNGKEGVKFGDGGGNGGEEKG